MHTAYTSSDRIESLLQYGVTHGAFPMDPEQHQHKSGVYTIDTAATTESPYWQRLSACTNLQIQDCYLHRTDW